MDLNATVFGQAISFVLFVLFCMKYIWQPLMAAIEKRQKDITADLSSAECAKKDLEVIQAEAINHLSQAKVKAQEIIGQANKHKELILKKAKVEAEAERKKILTQVQVEIDIERKRAFEELRKQVALLILVGAEKVIERSVDEATNSDIIDKIVDVM